MSYSIICSGGLPTQGYKRGENREMRSLCTMKIDVWTFVVEPPVGFTGIASQWLTDEDATLRSATSA